MDILTEKGAETLQQVADAIDIWRKNFPAIQYIHTPDNRPADFDGILAHNGRVAGIVEIKCRVSMTFEKFGTDYKSEWLVTFDKVRRCMQAADAIQAPFVGFLYFPHEKILLYKRIYDPVNGVSASMRLARSRTQATVNGGQIVRENAYIDMADAKRLQ